MCVTKFMHIIYLLVLSLNRFHNIYFFQTSDLLRCLFFLSNPLHSKCERHKSSRISVDFDKGQYSR